MNENLILSPILLFKKIVFDLICFMKESALIVRLGTSFYLLGPFFLLVERTPADIWLTVCGLSFLSWSMMKRQWLWLFHSWVRALLVFWCFCIVSALLSDNWLYSLGEAFVWVRFPLFAFASCFLLNTDRRVFRAFCLSTFLSLITMMFIFVCEFIYLGFLPARFSWPYGDLIPGAFIAKSGLFLFCISVGVAATTRGFLAFASGVFSILMLASTLLSGERVSFVLLLCSGTLVTLIMCRSIKSVLVLYSSVLIAVGGLLSFIPELADRYLDQTIRIILEKNSGYREIWNSAVLIIKKSDFMGIGPDNYRQLCEKLLADTPDVWCNNHPHNFLLQILVETGLIGLILYFTFVALMIKQGFQNFSVRAERTIFAVSFVVPLAFFFPLQSNNDFFGQWVNVFMWTALGTALAASHFDEPNEDLV